MVVPHCRMGVLLLLLLLLLLTWAPASAPSLHLQDFICTALQKSSSVRAPVAKLMQHPWIVQNAR